METTITGIVLKDCPLRCAGRTTSQAAQYADVVDEALPMQRAGRQAYSRTGPGSAGTSSMTAGSPDARFPHAGAVAR